MKIKNKQFGLTLIELLVVIGIIAVVVAISLPAINAMQKSFDSTGAEGMISAALSTARTLAISRQQYVGVRFQLAGIKDSNVMSADQYMVFVIYDYGKSGLVNGFVAVEGYKPIKLPANMGVIEDTSVISTNDDFFNAMKFTVVFSPASKLVIHQVHTRNQNGKPDTSTDSNDVVFNTFAKITASTNSRGQFLQDDSDEDGRRDLKIYNRKEFEKYAPNERYSKYLVSLPVLYINPYTGGIIEK